MMLFVACISCGRVSGWMLDKFLVCRGTRKGAGSRAKDRFRGRNLDSEGAPRVCC
jgi:DNA-directed RNA polymerase subunit N (RpoN/RPB10)